jgi:hypothetical protein
MGGCQVDLRHRGADHLVTFAKYNKRSSTLGEGEPQTMDPPALCALNGGKPQADSLLLFLQAFRLEGVAGEDGSNRFLERPGQPVALRALRGVSR